MNEAVIYLSEIAQIKNEIEETTRKLTAYRTMAEGLSSPDYKLGTRIDVSGNYRREELMVMSAVASEKLEKLLKTLNEEYFELELILVEMKDIKLAQLLKDIYITGLSFEETADKMGYTERHIRRLNEKALDALSALLRFKSPLAQKAK